MAPKRPSIPIVVYAGRDIKEYLAWGMAAIAAMVLLCPVCGARLAGNGWRLRMAKRQSKSFESDPVWIPVRELVCPFCRKADRHPCHFRVLPSLLRPFKHFLQSVRLRVFDAALGEGLRAAAMEAATGVDRWLIGIWLGLARPVLERAGPELGARITEFGGRLPALGRDAPAWERWWALGLALRAAMSALEPSLADAPCSVLEWVTVVGATWRCWWALAP